MGHLKSLPDVPGYIYVIKSYRELEIVGDGRVMPYQIKQDTYTIGVGTMFVPKTMTKGRLAGYFSRETNQIIKKVCGSKLTNITTMQIFTLEYVINDAEELVCDPDYIGFVAETD